MKLVTSIGAPVKIAYLPTLIAAVLASGVVSAHDEDGDADINGLPQQVQELFLTESVWPNERGEYQPFLAADHRRVSHESWSTLLNAGLEYGITDQLQVAVSMPWVAIREDGRPSRSGAGDLSAELFYNLVPATAAMALSLAAELTLPTGNEARGFGEGEKEIELTLIMAGRAANMYWQLNLGCECTENEAELLYSVAVLPTRPDWHLVPTVELSGTGTDEDRELYATPGLHWRLAGNSSVGVGTPIGLTSDAEHLRVMLYYTVELQ